MTGSTMELIAATPPASPATVLALTYLPTGQQIPITNQTVREPSTGDDLEQHSWWCRPDSLVDDPVAADAQPWVGLPNDVCRVASPGIINLRVDLVNVGVVESPAKPIACIAILT